MNSTILICVCVPCAIVFFIVWGLVALNEKGINPFEEIFGRYRKQSLLGLLLIPILIIKALVFGSTKAPTNEPTGEVTSPTNVPRLMMAWPGSLTPDSTFQSGFTSNEVALGYVLWRVGTNEVWNFDSISGAHIAERWRLRGAADDWVICATTNLGPVALTTNGRLITTNGLFVAYDEQLALVPEAHWRILGTNTPSRAWWAETRWQTTLFTWQNAFLGRDTNMPISVQAEFTREGDFVYRYNLGSTGTNLTSKLYYRIRPEDMKENDRDGDGISTYDEVMVYHTNPGLVDSDGDGLLDNKEIFEMGTDPTTRSVPNEEIIARVMGSATNNLYKEASRLDLDTSLTTLKLWDGFAADWPHGMTNLVYERVINLGIANGWQSYFLSSKASEAGDWDLHGLVLEWSDGCGGCGTVTASPYGDSFLLPVTNSLVTIRLRAVESKISCLKPMYLIGYAPSVQISGGTPICDANGVERVYYVTTGDRLMISIDRSQRPCKARLSPNELMLPGLANMAAFNNNMIAYDGNENGGLITVKCPGAYQLPAFLIDDPQAPEPYFQQIESPSEDERRKWIICLEPSIDFSGSHEFIKTGVRYNYTNGNYYVDRYYPLDSKCLWRSWQETDEGFWHCMCEPKIQLGDKIKELPFVESRIEGGVDWTFATGIITILGQEVWRGSATHTWRDIGSGGSTKTVAVLLSEGDECDNCWAHCSDGKCYLGDGTDLNSIKFRLSLGMPRRGQDSGFVYFESNESVMVTPNLLRVSHRDDALVTDEIIGNQRIITCFDRNGRQITITEMTNGVRLTVTICATGELEAVWEIFNVEGNSHIVRIRQLSRLNNVMSDETYTYDEENDVWTKMNHITGITERLERISQLNNPADGKLYEVRTTYDADDNQINRIYTESSLIGTFGHAVLRETYWEQDTGYQIKWREATYWNDAVNRDRHGQVKLLTSNCGAWEYHDYDSRGFETLRVEQRNGAFVPIAFPEVIAGDLYGIGNLSNAFVTVLDYTPFTGDDCHSDDLDKVRCETRYVVQNGCAVCIARTWTRYTHILYNGCDAVKSETWRAASGIATRTNSENAYSYVITYSDGAEHVPFILRGEIAEELSEDGSFMESEIENFDDVIRITRREANAPTYEVVERDCYFGNETRRAIYLSDSNDLIDEMIMSYDDKNRLRSTKYFDGTSETNAWSCCRKLWSRNREGRTTLRSAVTGYDTLYYADEEVWLRGLSTNGEHQVTQHFFDGLGREIETISYSASQSGEATDFSASNGKIIAQSTRDYPFGGADCSVEIDARGKTTVNTCVEFFDRVERIESVFTNGAVEADLQTIVTQWRNGTQIIEKIWDDKWTRESKKIDYDSNGCEICYEITAASDYGTITNRIEVKDFLGRVVREMTPHGNTETTYHGATDKPRVMTLTAGDVVRVSTQLYDVKGDAVGTVQDGVTNRTDESYEIDQIGNWWKVTRHEKRNGEKVRVLSESREQLTGREHDILRRRIDIDADGVVEEMVERVGQLENERIVSISNAVLGITTQVRYCGVTKELMTPDETWQFAFDAFGRKVTEARQVEDVDGIRIQPSKAFVYDAVGDILVQKSYTNETNFMREAYLYDNYGRRVLSVDALGHETVTSYDARGNVIEQSGATWPVRYDYDTAGRRISLSTTKDGRIWDVTTWGYNPETGVCTTKRYPNGSLIRYSATPDGLLQMTTKASGVWSSNTYDAKRLLVGTTSSDGANNATFAYDELGEMTEASNSNAHYIYTRHSNGIVTNEILSLNEDIQIRRTLDNVGRLGVRGVSGWDLQTILYDESGRVCAISNDTAIVNYRYGNGGVNLGYSLGFSNGVRVEHCIIRDRYQHDQIIAVSNLINGVTIVGETYTRDAKGRIVGRMCNSQRAVTYCYDAKGQIIRETSEQPQRSKTYSYDHFGNIVNFEAPLYTIDGEVVSSSGKTLNYDSASRLTTITTNGVTIASYGYDAFDRRVCKTTAEAMTMYFYDGWNLVQEKVVNTNGTIDVIEYYWGKDIAGSLDAAGGIGGLLYLKCNGTVYIPLYDANGNVTAYADSTGAIIASFVYDAFGNCIVQSSNLNQQTIDKFLHFRYSTKYFDNETGFSYYGYRYYEPAQLCWLTYDPIEEQGGLNLHCFCENDGVNKVDWLGMISDPSQVNDARRFWRLMARRLKEEKQYNLAAYMLEVSLVPHIWSFGAHSEMSIAIKNSAEYSMTVTRLMESYPQGWRGSVAKRDSFRYEGGDLLAAANRTVNDIDVWFRGRGCKGKTSSWFKLKVRVSSDYGYALWRYDDLILSEGEKSNIKKFRSEIQAFNWTAEFKDRRP